MTTFVRSIVSDLVDRRLWPVPVVLLAALVAIPVLLLRPASHATAPTKSVASAPAPVLGTDAVSLSDPNGGPVVGKVKDPFHQLHVPKGDSGATSSGGALGPAKPGAEGGAGGAGAPSAGGVTGGGGVTTGGSGRSGGSAPRATLEVRFGLATGRPTRRDLRPGAPLPSPTNPLLVYLGQNSKGQAAFLVSSDAQPQGDGRCEPDKSICSTLYMKEGSTEFFDVTGPAGTVQYQLEVLRIRD